MHTPENTPADITSDPLHEAEVLTNELKRLLIRNETALEKEGIREEVEVLECWMESYRRGLKAAYKLSGNGMELLHQVHDRLKLASEELQRLESEGGNPPATTEQAHEAEEYDRAAKRIERVMNEVEQLLHKDNQVV